MQKRIDMGTVLLSESMKRRIIEAIMKKSSKELWLFLSVFIALVLSGCAGRLPGSARYPELDINEGKMIYARQVLVHYDAAGKAVSRYYEIWAVPGKSACRELNKDGEEIRTFLDSGDRHIAYNSGNREAVVLKFNKVFMLDYEALKKVYPVETVNEDQEYADRNCSVHLLESDEGDDWLKIYIDSETGFVLFCDAPLFALKTADFEILPEDPEKFSEPKDLDFQ